MAAVAVALVISSAIWMQLLESDCGKSGEGGVSVFLALSLVDRGFLRSLRRVVVGRAGSDTDRAH